MSLEKGHLPGDESVADRVALAESVLAEAGEELPVFLGDGRSHFPRDTGRDEVATPAASLIVAERTCSLFADTVGIGDGQAGEGLHDPEGVVLVEHQAVGVTQHRFQKGMDFHRLQSAAAAQEAFFHAQRACSGPDQGQAANDVVHPVRPHLDEEMTHGW